MLALVRPRWALQTPRSWRRGARVVLVVAMRNHAQSDGAVTVKSNTIVGVWRVGLIVVNHEQRARWTANVLRGMVALKKDKTLSGNGLLSPARSFLA